LPLYSGHRMHIEFSPADDGPCSIAMVVQSDDPPPSIESFTESFDRDLVGVQTGDERFPALASIFRRAADSLERDPAEAASGERKSRLDVRPVDRTLALAANWLVSHPSLFCLTEIRIPETGLAAAEAEIEKQVHWESSLAPAMLDGNGVDEVLLVRGNSNTPKDPVPRRFLEAFASATEASAAAGEIVTVPEHHFSEASHGSGRKELAAEMLRSPLVPRVAVNRVWHHLFGRGIVPTVDNLGVLGLPPSHPDLLDHLAAEFVKNGWSTKALIRSLVLSRTYQMSSHSTEADLSDPNNEFWHRMPIKRLEGEIIRDALLTVSGRLDSKPYGPSVPIHLTEFMQGRGRPGASGPLDGNGRRSIYISVRRNFLSPMMLAFDTPSPFSTVGRRTVSNVPAQALILMNDPFVVQQADRWVDRLMSESSQTTEQRLDRMYLMAFGRHPSSADSAEAIAFLTSEGAGQPEADRDAWRHLCHVLFNVKEFVFVE
jgi:hypothetical protein